MITVENLLDAYAIALDLWADPELAILENGHPRENPTPEYAELIRKAVSAENAKLRELVADMWGFIEGTDEDCGDVTFSSCFDYCKHDTADDGCSKTGECWYEQRMRELGVEV